MSRSCCAKAWTYNYMVKMAFCGLLQTENTEKNTDKETLDHLTCNVRALKI